MSGWASETNTDPLLPVEKLIAQDHARIRDLFSGYLSFPDEARDWPENIQLLERLFWEIGIHGCLEEEVLYPQMLKVPETKDYVLQSVGEHRKAKEDVIRFYNILKGEEGAPPRPLLINLRSTIEEYMSAEECEVLPRFEKGTTIEERRALAQKFSALKETLQSQATDLKDLLNAPTTAATLFDNMPSILAR